MVKENLVKITPRSQRFFKIRLPTNSIYIEGIRVVPDDPCGFRFQLYDSLQNYDPKNDPYGDKLAKDKILERSTSGERIVIKPKRPDLYVDKDYFPPLPLH